jgi:hypothetical protein
MTFPDIRTDRRFKNKLSTGQVTLGTFIQVGGPEVVEICGAVELDFVILDTEHTPVGWERLSAMCVSALYSGTFPLLRIGTTEQALVTRALDTGARGVVFPQVQSAEQANVAARACRYPPQGTRGAAGSRNMAWGVNTTLADYIPAANDGIVCVIQIETRQGVDAADVCSSGSATCRSTTAYPASTPTPTSRQPSIKSSRRHRPAGSQWASRSPTSVAPPTIAVEVCRSSRPPIGRSWSMGWPRSGPTSSNSQGHGPARLLGEAVCLFE